MRNLPRPLLAALALGSLTACASFSGIEPRSSVAPAGNLAAERSLASAGAPEGGWPAQDWWKRLGDPQLDALVDEALRASPSMRVAQARLDRAVALAGSAQAALGPTVNGTLDVTRQRYSQNGFFPPPIAGSTYTTSTLGVNFAWDLDFWGRNRAAYDAAIGRQKAAQADAFAARLVLSSAVASAYVQLSRAYEQLALARLSLDQRQSVHELTQQRVSAGLDSQLELKQVETLIPGARVRIAQLEEEIALTRNQLAALAGAGPDRGLALEPPQLKLVPVAIPSRLPADLLARRPDVVASRWRVEAALGDVQSAKAEFYPNVNLAAFLGVQSVSWSRLLEQGSASPSIGAAIHLPLFAAPRLRAGLAARQADYDLAVEQYNEALVQGLREVVDQLASLRAIRTQQGEVESALASAEEAYRLATTRYKAGLGTLLQVLAAEQPMLEQRAARADLRARALSLSINLARALGGGFEDVTRQ